jgi:transglutaminase-like putative cysteine protease
VRSWPGTPLETELGDWRRNAETALPAADNPRAVHWRGRCTRRPVPPRLTSSDRARVFRGGGFFYTLQPPLLGGAKCHGPLSVRDRRGFCEHYAYAFAVLARSVGIPARIVGGYLGGEVNPVNRTVIVHQFDAHAWNEVWLEGQGWVRVDPTAVVAPDRHSLRPRARRGGGGELPRRVAAVAAALSRRELGKCAALRYDALTYRWQSWVTGFDGEAQFDLLQAACWAKSPSAAPWWCCSAAAP